MGRTNRKTPQGSRLPDGGRTSGNSNKRPSGPVPREVQVSKKLSFLLRHGAEKQGLKLGVGGYVNVADLLKNQMVKSAHITFDEVKQVVANNEKKRFGLAHIAENIAADQFAVENDGEDVAASKAAAANQSATATDDAIANEDIIPAHYVIRANQGHSIKLEDTSDLLTPITFEADNLPGTVVHGTRHEVWPAVLDTGGLKPMRRNHVHFATGLPEQLRSQRSAEQSSSHTPSGTERGVAALSVDEPTTPTVVSGMRVSSTVLIYLDLRKALQKGLQFFLSENGVVLTEGDDNGVVSLDLFERVEEKGGQILVQNGKIMSDLKGYAQAQGKKKKASKPKLNTGDRGGDDGDGDDDDDDDDGDDPKDG